MQLSLHADYSLRVLLYLGTHPDEVVPTRDISDAYGISKHHLVRVAQSQSFAEAARQLIRQYPKNPQNSRWLAVSLGQLERKEEARVAFNTMQSIAPTFLEQFLAKRIPILRPHDYEHVLEGLRKAGWPG